MGYQLGRSGKPLSKFKYLGNDERDDVKRALKLLAECNGLLGSEVFVWKLRAAHIASVNNKERDFVGANVLRMSKV